MLKLLGYLFAAGKLGKVALTGGTMILSVFVYALVFGWWYAVGFVGLIFVHEMGHFVAARMRGLDVGAPTSRPRCRAAMKCPISCTKIRPTKPTAYHQPKIHEYAMTDNNIVPPLSNTLPSLPALSSRSSVLIMRCWRYVP